MTNHDDCVSQAARRTWEGAASMGFAGSSSLSGAKCKPTRDIEEEDISVHPRRPSNRELVRDYASIDYRRSSQDDSYLVLGSRKLGQRASPRGNCGGSVDEESYTNIPTAFVPRSSLGRNVDDSAYGADTRESVSSEGDVSKLNGEKNAEDSFHSADGSNRGWCNFCFETGHVGTGCPWHPKIPVNDPQLTGWRNGTPNSQSPESPTEWPGVDFGDEKDWLQDTSEDALRFVESEGPPEEHLYNVFNNKQLPEEQLYNVHSKHPATRYADVTHNQHYGRDVGIYTTAHDRSWGTRNSVSSFHSDPSQNRRLGGGFVSYESSAMYGNGGWISVDPSKTFDEDALVRLHLEPKPRVGDTDVKALGVERGNEESFHTTRGVEDYDGSSIRSISNEVSEANRNFHELISEDASVDASFKSVDGSDTSVSSTRSVDSRRRRTGRSTEPSVPGHTRTNSATVTIIAPSVITFMHPRVPAKAVANSPVKPNSRPMEHRRSSSQGFAPVYIHPSSPAHTPQDYYNDQRSAAVMRANYEMGTGHHRMESVLMEPTKKQSVDETVGVVPPVIGKRCHKCWGYGHLHAQCPSRNGGANAKNSRDGSWKQCRYCRERGHVFSDCPHLQSTQSSGSYTSPTMVTSSLPRIVPNSPPKTVPRPL